MQAVIVPIYTNETRTKVIEKCGEVLGKLEEKGFRVHLDSREQYTPGFKFHEWELKGVPVRIEIGPKDIEKGEVSLVRRDFQERAGVQEQKLEEKLLEILDSITSQLRKRASEMLLIGDASDFKDVEKKLERGGFVRIPLCMQESCDENLKERTGAGVRGTLFGSEEKPSKGAKCAVCGTAAKELAFVARSY